MVGFGYAESVQKVIVPAEDPGKVCYLVDDSSPFAIVYLLLDLIFNAIIPLITVIIANCILVISLKKQRNEMNSFGSQSAAKKERGITWKIIAGNVFYVIWYMVPGTLYFTLAPLLPEGKEAVHDVREILIFSSVFL